MLTEACAISEALGESLQSIGRLCCRGTNKWCVLNTEAAKDAKDTKFLVFFSASFAPLRPLR